MSPLDRELINRKIKLIEEDLRRLNEQKNITLTQYRADEMLQLSVERLLERVIGRVIDINYHILKEKHALLPKDYFESFIKMAETGEVEKTLA